MTMSIYQLKAQFQRLLAPLLVAFIRLNITPNQITIATMLLCVCFGIALIIFPACIWLWGVFPIFMLFRMACNAIDGMLAKQTQQITKMGAVLNEMCDHVADVALYLPFAFVMGVNSLLVFAIIGAMLLAEIAGLMGVVVGIARRFDGPMGKSDRAFAFSLLAIGITFQFTLNWVNGFLIIILALLIWTIFNRLKAAIIS